MQKITGSNASLIEVRNLSLHYGDLKAVDDITFEVSKGEIFGFLGPNGAGKTTTIKVLTTLLPPTRGKASVFGYDVVSHGLEVRKRIGVVQQKLVFEYFLTVEKAMNLYCLLWNVPKSERKRKIDEILESFGLVEKKTSPLSELSIGLQRRVQVAQEFLHDPEILFLDEPTIGLDPLARRSTLDLIKTKASEGMTVFYTTHVLEEVDYLCDRAAVLVKGRIAALDTPRNLRRKYGGLKTLEIFLGDSSKKTISDFIEELARYGKEHNGFSDVKPELDLETITLRTQGPSDIFSDITSLASRLGVKIRSISMKEPSLEETFIEILKNNGVKA